MKEVMERMQPKMEVFNEKILFETKKLLEKEKPELKRKGNKHHYIFAKKVL